MSSDIRTAKGIVVWTMAAFLVMSLSALLFPCSAYAEVRTITAVGEYTMGEAETPLIAKERADQQAMRAASEQAGVYLESLTEVKNMKLTKDEIMVSSISPLPLRHK